MRATLTGSRAEREECVGGWGGPGTEWLGGSGEIGGGRGGYKPCFPQPSFPQPWTNTKAAALLPTWIQAACPTLPR